MRLNDLIKEKKVLLMGILNFTPDSFSDGGDFNNIDDALAHAKEMIDEGSDIIDLGCESTRPNADVVDVNTELERIKTILPKLRTSFPNILISVDTYKPEVAEYAIENGADIINDVSGLNNYEMLSLVANHKVPIVIMHNGEAINSFEVFDKLKAHANKCIKLGIDKMDVIVDPGIGFGKDAKLNIEITKTMKYLESFGFNILYGCSRKRTTDYLIGCNSNPKERDLSTSLLNYEAIKNGAKIIRVHNVSYARQVVEFLKKY